MRSSTRSRSTGTRCSRRRIRACSPRASRARSPGRGAREIRSRWSEVSMWLEAIFTHEDLVQVMQEFLPVKIYLHHEGEEVKADRWLLLGSATEMALIAEEGLQMTCPAELTWGIAGMSPSVK